MNERTLKEGQQEMKGEEKKGWHKCKVRERRDNDVSKEEIKKKIMNGKRGNGR